MPNTNTSGHPEKLTRATVTAASRIMLPAYVVLATYFGLLYLFDPQGRVERAPGLAFARLLMPMPVWGLCFLAVAVLMAGALVTGRRIAFIFALYLYAFGALIWAGVYFGATFLSDSASFGGPAWPLFVATACRASARSLMRTEV